MICVLKCFMEIHTDSCLDIWKYSDAFYCMRECLNRMENVFI